MNTRNLSSRRSSAVAVFGFAEIAGCVHRMKVLRVRSIGVGLVLLASFGAPRR